MSRIKELTKFGFEVSKNWFSPRVARANIATTFRCNHMCATCNIWKDNNKQDIDKEITASEIFKIINNNNLIWVSLTGGEPFLNREIVEIVGISMMYTKLTSIICNGSKPELIEKAIRKGLEHSNSLIVLDLSLEGDKEFHDKVIGINGSYDRVVETIQRLKKINNDRLMIGIEHTLSGYTNGHYKYIEKFAKEYDVELTYTAEQYSSYYKNLDNKIIRPDKPNIRFGSSPITMFSDIFLWGAFSGRSNKCVAGEYSCFIDPYCVVHPCLLHTPHPIKNLRESNYVIGKLEYKDVIKGCNGCWTPCESYATTLFRPWRLL